MTSNNIYLLQIHSSSIKNKYTGWYISLCNKRLILPYDGEYKEKHHILPKCFKEGGESDVENLLYVSAREHFVLHLLLIKMFHCKRKTAQMMKAASCFFQSNLHQDRKLNSRQFDFLRKQSALSNKILNTGKIRNDDTKKKMSAANKGRIVRIETREKLREQRKGIPLSEKHKHNLKIAMENYLNTRTEFSYSDEAIKNFKAGQKRRFSTYNGIAAHSKAMKVAGETRRNHMPYFITKIDGVVTKYIDIFEFCDLTGAKYRNIMHLLKTYKNEDIPRGRFKGVLFSLENKICP